MKLSKIKKYKYYFRKSRSEIVKDVLFGLFLVGAILVASTSPYFGINVLKAIKNRKRYQKKKIYSAFNYLRRRGLIKVERRDHQIYISLTKEGRTRAGWLQIDSLKIKKPKKWDGRWRLIIFDIAELKRIYRDAFRGKLKEMGLYQLQKSIWVCPYDCLAEIELLREFFGLSEKELRLVVAQEIGNDNELKKFFKI